MRKFLMLLAVLLIAGGVIGILYKLGKLPFLTNDVTQIISAPKLNLNPTITTIASPTPTPSNVTITITDQMDLLPPGPFSVSPGSIITLKNETTDDLSESSALWIVYDTDTNQKVRLPSIKPQMTFSYTLTVPGIYHVELHGVSQQSEDSTAATVQITVK